MKLYLTMPQPGETITEGTIVKWIVKPGSLIKEGEHLVELETEKAVFEYESPYEGKLIQILAQDGQVVPVGNPLAIFEIEDSKAKNYIELGIGKEVGGGKPEEIQKPGASPNINTSTHQHINTILSPLIRNLVHQYQIQPEELSSIRGTGPGRRITKENILAYLEEKKIGRHPESTEGGQRIPRVQVGDPSQALLARNNVEVVPCSPIRARIAENMMSAKASIPHAHTGLTVDITPLIKYRETNKKKFQKKYGIPLGFLPLIFPTLKKAIQKIPVVNASFRDEGGKKSILLHKKINLGVAVDTERGLHIPVIHGAEKMDALEFAQSLEPLLERARTNRLTVRDLTGMTFTFNNFGFFGATLGVQIILPPQSATLGMGKIEQRPWVVKGKVAVRWISDFVLAFDHRVLDGRDAGLFLKELKEGLENFKGI